MLTPEKLEAYVELQGSRCPFCQSIRLNYDRAEVCEGSYQQEVECRTCGAEWIDVYSLSRVDVITQPFQPGESS
jgi:hypothetical protein